MARQPHQSETQRPLLIAIVVILALYIGLLSFVLQPLNGFWAGDQGVKLIQIQSLLLQRFQTNALQIPPAQSASTGASPLRGQYYEYQGRTYAMFSDVFAAASAVPFFIFGYPGLYIIPVLSTVVTLFFIGLLGRQLLPSGWSIPLVLYCGLATSIGFYGLVFWEHAPALACTTIALWLTYKTWEGAALRRLAYAGILVGCATWLRNEAILFAPALALACITMPKTLLRSWAWLGVGVILGTAPLLVYNAFQFGTPLGPHIATHALAAQQASHGAGFDIRAYGSERLDWFGHNLLSASPILLPWVIAGIVLWAIGMRLQRAWWPKAQYSGFDIPIFLGIAIVCLGIEWQFSRTIHTTLLMTLPTALLVLLPSQPGEQRLLHTQRLALVASGYVGLCLLAPLPDGGAQWGPRLLLPALPALVIWVFQRVAGAFQDSTRTVRQVLLIALVALTGAASALSMLGGVAQAADSNRNTVRIVSATLQSHQQIIITDRVEAPSLLAQVFYSQIQIYYVQSKAEYKTLETNLQQQQAPSFYLLGDRSGWLHAYIQEQAQLTPMSSTTQLPYNLIGRVYQLTH